LRREIDAVVAQFVPPRDVGVAQTLATSGEVFLDLIKTHPPQSGDEAVATVRTAALIGGPEALRLIADLAIQFPKITERECIRAWRLFDPEEFGRAVLSQIIQTATSIIEIADPDMLNAVRYIPAPRGIRLDAALLPALSTHSDGCRFEEIEIIECSSNVNLSPLRWVKDLKRVNLECVSSPPDFGPLAHINSLRILEISYSRTSDGFRNLEMLSQVERLILRANTGYYDLSTLPRRPIRLSALHIKGWRYLVRIDQMAKWNGLSEIQFSDCPRLTDLGGLASLTTLETLILERVGEVDLTPLQALERLGLVRLKGFNEICLQPLSGMHDITIEVPQRTMVHCNDLRGAGSRVIRDSSD
jgi:hypothetical protein